MFLRAKSIFAVTSSPLASLLTAFSGQGDRVWELVRRQIRTFIFRSKMRGRPTQVTSIDPIFVRGCTSGDWCVWSQTNRLHPSRSIQSHCSREERCARPDATDEKNSGSDLFASRSSERARAVFSVWHRGRLSSDFSGSTIAASSITERIDELRQLSQVWRAGCPQVPGLSHRDCNPAFRPQRTAFLLQHSFGIKPGVRPLSFRAQWGRLSAHQMGCQSF